MTVTTLGDLTITTALSPQGATRQVATAPGSDGANVQAILNAAANALATNLTFLGLATPTNAQVLAQVQALTRQMDGVIRLLTGRLEATG